MFDQLRQLATTPKISDEARAAVAGALRSHRKLIQTIKSANGSRPKLAMAVADTLGLDRPNLTPCR